MGNWTSIIIIPAIGERISVLEHCNQYLKERYDGDEDEYPIFSISEIPFSPRVLVGNFPYLNTKDLIKHIKEWFCPKPEYRVVDETEKPSKYTSKAYTQTNERWGVIQVFIKRAHDGQFWLCNISKDKIERVGLEDIPTL